MSESTDSELPPPRALFVLLAAVSVLPVTIHLPALPDIADTFGSGFALVNFSLAGYAIATVLAEAVSGALADRYGRRPVVLVSVSVFTVASLGCALAPNIETFLLCPMLQASIAACFSVSMVAINETSSGDEAVKSIGFAGMGWALAPMLGTTLGGTLNEFFGWRSIFVALAVLGCAILLVAMRRLKGTSTDPGTAKGAFKNSLRRTLRSTRFWAYALCMTFSMGTLYVFLGGAPLVMDEHFGGSSSALGLYMAMVPGGFVLGSYLAGVLGPRVSRSRILVYARLLTCTGLLVGLVLAMSYDLPPLTFFLFCTFIGVGNGLTTPVVNMGVMSEHEETAGTALGLSAAVSLGGRGVDLLSGRPGLGHH